MSNQAQDQNENKQEQNSKVEKAYDGVLAKLTAVVSGKLQLATAIPNDQVESLVKELFEEDYEKLRAEVKIELRELLKKHVTMTQEIKKKEQELKNTVLAKKKEFTAACNEVFKKVENIGELTKNYAESLKAGMPETTAEEN